LKQLQLTAAWRKAGLTVVFLLYFVCQRQKVYFKKQKENILYVYNKLWL